MDSKHIQTALTNFIADEFLDGDAEELDEHTPLLELGVIDSLAMVALLDFIKRCFSAELPDDEVSPRNFASIAALERLISRTLAETDAHA